MRYLSIFFAALLLLSVTACSGGGNSNGENGENDAHGEGNGAEVESVNLHNPNEQVTDWQVALEYLEDGNKRFVEDKTMARDTNAKDRNILKNGQKPFAVIVTCSDSRVAPEIYFDQKLGDIFVIRNAGNIADKTALGSIEYAVEHLEAPLVVVVGHSSCGAVTGALNGGEFPENLESIIETIEPDIEDSADVDEAVRKNIEYTVDQIKENEIVEHMEATVIGAYYDIATGEVVFD